MIIKLHLSKPLACYRNAYSMALHLNVYHHFFNFQVLGAMWACEQCKCKIKARNEKIHFFVFAFALALSICELLKCLSLSHLFPVYLTNLEIGVRETSTTQVQAVCSNLLCLYEPGFKDIIFHEVIIELGSFVMHVLPSN